MNCRNGEPDPSDPLIKGWDKATGASRHFTVTLHFSAHEGVPSYSTLPNCDDVKEWIEEHLCGVAFHPRIGDCLPFITVKKVTQL